MARLIQLIQMIAAGLALALAASAQTACIDNRVGLDRWTLAAFEKELASLVQDLRLVPCAAGDATAVVVIRSFAPRRYAAALGLARRHRGRILNQFEIYVDSVARLIGRAQPPLAIGRALARVTAHELQHYRHQRSDHDERGLFAAAFQARDLE